jgi:hypothetical protein
MFFFYVTYRTISRAGIYSATIRGKDIEFFIDIADCRLLIGFRIGVVNLELQNHVFDRQVELSLRKYRSIVELLFEKVVFIDFVCLSVKIKKHSDGGQKRITRA